MPCSYRALLVHAGLSSLAYHCLCRLVSAFFLWQVHEAAAKSATHLNRLQVECNALTRECAQLQDDNRALALVRGSKLNACKSEPSCFHASRRLFEADVFSFWQVFQPLFRRISMHAFHCILYRAHSHSWSNGRAPISRTCARKTRDCAAPRTASLTPSTHCLQKQQETLRQCRQRGRFKSRPPPCRVNRARPICGDAAATSSRIRRRDRRSTWPR